MLRNLIIRLLKPKAIYAQILLLLLAFGFIYLGYEGHLDKLEAMLSKPPFAFRIGDFNFSLYLLLKGTIAVVSIFWLAGLISDFGERALKNISSVRRSNRDIITKVMQIVIYTICFLIVLDVLGIDLTALTVLGGAVGIGLGFGLQKIASNFVSGIIMLFEKSVEADDLVELSDGTFGTIRKTGARYTLLETYDGKEILIPNEDFVTSRVTNWTYSNTKGRVSIPIGVSYGSDIHKAYDLILEAAKEHPLCISDPEPTCYLREFADSSVNFLLFFWVDDVIKGRYKPQSDVMFAIWDKFKENGIEIPFPQRDVHIKNIKELKGGK